MSLVINNIRPPELVLKYQLTQANKTIRLYKPGGGPTGRAINLRSALPRDEIIEVLRQSVVIQELGVKMQDILMQVNDFDLPEVE